MGNSAKNLSGISSFVDLRNRTVTSLQKNSFNILRDSLKDLTIDEATKKLQDLKLNPQLASEILQAANNGKLLSGSADDIAKGIEKVGKSGSKLDDVFNIFSGIGSEAIRLFKILATNPLTWLIGIGAAAVALEDFFTVDYEEANEALEESANNYNETKNTLESLNSELETTSARMSELESKESLTLTEEAELESLKSQNAELERKIALEEKLLAVQAKAAMSDAKDAMGKESHSIAQSIQFGDSSGKSNFKNSVGTVSDVDAVKENLDLISEYENKLPELEANITKAKEKIADSSGLSKVFAEQELRSAKKELDFYEDSIKTLYSDLDTRSTNIQSQLDILKIDPVANADEIKVLEDSLKSIADVDLSPSQKALKGLEDFFSSKSSGGKNVIKDQLKDAYEAGKDLEKELNRMGLSLDDLGIDNISQLESYLKDTASAAKEAEKSIRDYSASIEDVADAGSTENSDSSWAKGQAGYNTAKELLKEGKTGVDDFQVFAKFINPKAVKDYMSKGGKYAADAYQKAFEDSMKIADRWYGEDQLKSMENFVNDFKKDGLFDVVTDSEGLWDITTNFETTAEAADKYGTSVENVETMLKALSAYGYDFSNIIFSTDGLSRFETALNGLHEIEKSLDKGSSKDRLSKLLTGWDEKYAECKDDLDSLTEAQIIEIEFEYDLAQIQQRINELQRVADEGGDSQTWAELNANKKAYRDESESRTGNKFAQDISYNQTSNDILALQSQLKNASAEQKEDIQEQISLLYDLQNAANDAFADSELSWEEFIKTDEYADIIEEMIASSEDAKKQIADLLGIDVKDLELQVDADVSNAIGKISGIMKNNGKTITMRIDATTDQIQTQINNLQQGQRIVFQAELDGESKQIVAFRNQDGVIRYAAEDNGVYYYLEENKEADGTINYTLGEYPTEIPSAEQEIVRVPNNEGIQTAPTITQFVKRSMIGTVGRADGTMLSIAKADGTAYNVMNTIPISAAHARGNVGIPKNQTALVNEEYINGHSESIVRDGVWRLIPGGAHMENLKKGDIIFSAQQTEDLLKSGRTPGHARTYASGTVLSPAYRLGSNDSWSEPINSSSSSDSSSADEFKETIDEIEILLNEFERHISNLDKVAQAAYRKWTERNKALSDEMSKVAELIEVQKNAYDGYREKAASIGLSDEWVEKIIDGAIAIEEITDEDLAKKIKEFQTWADKAKECSDAILDLKDDLADLASQKFENVVTEYENLLSTIEHRIDMLEGSVDKVEAKGYIVSTKMYEEIAKSQQDGIVLLEKEYNTLKTELASAMDSGDIELYSEQWYELVGEIQDVESSLMDMNTELAETQKNMRELEWETFDRMQDMLSGVQSEAEFLTELLSNEKMYNDDASITSFGQATMGLHAVNYNAYMSQAEDYAAQIQKINKELANDPNNIDLLDRRQELLESQREMILSAEKEKETILDLIKEGYDALLDSMKDIIEKRKDLFSDMSDMYDFEKSVSELNKEISSLEKQRQAYMGNTSEEGRAAIQRIDTQLEEARAELEETEYDQYIKDQEKMLDDLYDETEAFLNARLDEESALLQEIINSTNANASEIKDTLESETKKVGITLSDEMQSIWGTNGTFTTVVSTYDGEFVNQLTTTNNTLDTIRGYLAKMAGESDKIADSDIGNIDSNANELSTIKPKEEPVANTSPTKTESTTKKEIKVGGKINAGSAKIYDYAGDKSGEKQYFSKDPIYKVLSEKDGYLQVRHHKSSNGVTGWFKKSDVKAYKNGGLLDNTGLFWGDGTPSNPEIVLKPSDSDNFMELRDILRSMNENNGISSMLNPENMFNSLKSFVNLHNFERSTMGQSVLVDIGGIEMYGVNDVETFGNNLVHHLKNNQTVSRIIQADTLGALFGKNSLSKHKY